MPGAGRIVIYFGPTDTNLGQLDQITISADKQHLRFEFWNGQYGPVVFDLMRSF